MLQGHSTPVSATAWISDHHIISCSADCKVRRSGCVCVWGWGELRLGIWGLSESFNMAGLEHSDTGSGHQQRGNWKLSRRGLQPSSHVLQPLLAPGPGWVFSLMHDISCACIMCLGEGLLTATAYRLSSILDTGSHVRQPLKA